MPKRQPDAPGMALMSMLGRPSAPRQVYGIEGPFQEMIFIYVSTGYIVLITIHKRNAKNEAQTTRTIEVNYWPELRQDSSCAGITLRESSIQELALRVINGN